MKISKICPVVIVLFNQLACNNIAYSVGYGLLVEEMYHPRKTIKIFSVSFAYFFSQLFRFYKELNILLTYDEA